VRADPRRPCLLPTSSVSSQRISTPKATGWPSRCRPSIPAKLALPRIRQKYHVSDTQVEALLDLIALRGDLVTPTRTVRVCRDPKDDMLIEAALAGAAKYVVTGDEDLLVLRRFETMRFVTPRTFLTEF
jgi:predicted nucleic acid-binding protein